MPKWFHIALICLSVDAFYHYAIDNSLALAFSEALSSIANNSEVSQVTMDMYSQMSPFMQSYIINIIAILFALVIAIPVGYNLNKKQNQLL